jgi:hypothetical protein
MYYLKFYLYIYRKIFYKYIKFSRLYKAFSFRYHIKMISYVYQSTRHVDILVKKFLFLFSKVLIKAYKYVYIICS